MRRGRSFKLVSSPEQTAAKAGLLLGILVALVLAGAQELTYTFENGAITGLDTLSVSSFQQITFTNNSNTAIDVEDRDKCRQQ